MRRLLGMTDWFSRFIQNYAQTAAPLHDCLKKDRVNKCKLSEEAINAISLLLARDGGRCAKSSERVRGL